MQQTITQGNSSACGANFKYLFTDFNFVNESDPITGQTTQNLCKNWQTIGYMHRMTHVSGDIVHGVAFTILRLLFPSSSNGHYPEIVRFHIQLCHVPYNKLHLLAAAYTGTTCENSACKRFLTTITYTHPSI